MPFTESLTVRIVGDSAPLQRELDQLEQRIASVSSRLNSAELGRGLDRLAGRFTELVRPLEQVGRLVDRLAVRIQALSQIPVRLNVAPALQGLGLISQQLDIIAAKLNALAVPRPLLPAPDVPALPQPVRRFASGGLVSGPAGYDRIPAMLSAGEFVLRESAVRQLGVTFLNQLNQHAPPASATPHAQPASSVSNSSAITNVGGIAIHVSRATDVNTLIRDLRFQDFRLRNRQG